MPEWKESGEILYQKMRVRSCAYLNHVVKQDHRRVKRRVNPVFTQHQLLTPTNVDHIYPNDALMHFPADP